MVIVVHRSLLFSSVCSCLHLLLSLNFILSSVTLMAAARGRFLVTTTFVAPVLLLVICLEISGLFVL